MRVARTVKRPGWTRTASPSLGADVAAAPRDARIEANDDASLLEVVRRELGLRAAARGCQDGSCGSCRVLVDGAIVNACALAWRDVADGAIVEAYEDVAGDPEARRVVDAFSSERPTRCRLCVAGLGVTAVSLARRGASGDRDAIAAAIGDATCMCTGRGSWRRALGK